MPAVYAHYRLGQEVLRRLSAEDAEAVDRHRSLYDTGLHGPDLLFYYKPAIMTTPGCTGHGTHRMNGRDFFRRAARAVTGSARREAARAYLYGYACHFALDSLCHPYVEQRVREGVPHTRTETSFDRYLMICDGIRPTRHKTCSHIKINREDAETIAEFYTYIKAAQIEKAAKSMVFYNELLRARSGFRRRLMYGLLRIFKLYEQLHGMIMTDEPDTACTESDAELMRLFDTAAGLAAELIRQLDAHIERGEPLGAEFDHTFGED